MLGGDMGPEKSRRQGGRSPRSTAIGQGCGLLVLMVIALLGLTGCGSGDIAFTTEYQAVYLDNSQVFFGKLSDSGSPFPILRDVYFIQTRMDREKKRPSIS
jgi:hypothetical protein